MLPTDSDLLRDVTPTIDSTLGPSSTSNREL